MSEDVKRAFASHYLDVACNMMLCAMRCLQETSIWTEHPEEVASLKEAFNMTVGMYQDVERWNKEEEDSDD